MRPATLSLFLGIIGSALPLSATEPAHLHFVFGGQPVPGATTVRPTDTYNVNRSYGFDLGSQVEQAPPAGDGHTFVTGAGNRPFFFSVRLEPGAYDVSVTLGDPAAETIATVKSETRRLMLEAVHVPAGQARTFHFLAHVRSPRLPDGKMVRMKPREDEPILYVQWDPAKNSPLIPFLELDWDEKLTLEFSDRHVALSAVEISPAPAVTTVFIAGDSTATDQMMEPIAAWGQMLPRWFEPPVVVANYAECGETAPGFIAARRWEKIMSEIRAGDTVLIEFGINDRRLTLAEFQDGLRRMVREVRARAAIPVLVTPQNLRTNFFDAAGHGQQTLGPYPDALRAVARSENVMLIDLNAISRQLYEAIGPAKLPLAFFDGTHHSDWGAYELARCVATAIKRSTLPIARHVIAGADFDPARPDPYDAFHLPPDPQLDPARPGGCGTPDGRGPMAGAIEHPRR